MWKDDWNSMGKCKRKLLSGLEQRQQMATITYDSIKTNQNEILKRIAF